MKLDEMPDASRVWIYLCDRLLSEDEVRLGAIETEQFIDEWTSHGRFMNAGYSFVHGRFFVLAVDEAQAKASGCGIDKSVRHVERLGALIIANFFNRKLVAYLDSGSVQVLPIHEFWAMRKAGRIGPDTQVFNTLVSTLGDFRTNWIVPFHKSWHEEMWSS